LFFTITCPFFFGRTEQLVNYFNANNDFRREHVAMSIGITDNDSAKFKEVYKQVDKGNLKYVCIDVANGYSERFSNSLESLENNIRM
jgi:hypothetical protein